MEIKLSPVPTPIDATDSRPSLRQDGGKTVPTSGNEPPPVPPKTDLEKIIQSIETFLATSGRELNFRIDGSSGRTVITVSNPTTNEVIRQIPSEEMLKISTMMAAKDFTRSVLLPDGTDIACYLASTNIDLCNEWI